MAKINFNNLLPENETNSNTSSVGFFNLADGEEAIVRIMIDTTDDLDIRTVHNVEMTGYQYGRKMNCLRDPQEPIDKCPLCAAGKPLMQRLFIRLIHYVTNPQTNQIIPTPKIWERSVRDRNFGAQALLSCINSYGALSDIICKIVRRGQKLNTEYQLIPNLNPNIYRPEIYIKDASLFGDYNPLGGAILDKTAEEYTQFLLTGSFPINTSNNSNQITPREYNEPPVSVPHSAANFNNTSAQVNTTGGYATPSYNTTANFQAPPVTTTQPQVDIPLNNAVPVRETLPWENASIPTNPAVGGFERPRRY